MSPSSRAASLQEEAGEGQQGHLHLQWVREVEALPSCRETLPSVNEHVLYGMEEIVRSFRTKMEEEFRADPTQPFPAFYLATRYVFI